MTQSSWSRPRTGSASPGGEEEERPQKQEGTANADPRPTSKGTARAIAEEVSAAVANRVGAAVRSGIGGLEQALDDPARALSAELSKEADLPEIEGDDPLASIGVRLDREADLWRSVAMRQLARAAFLDRLAVTSTLVVLVGEIVLAAIAGFRALFASDHADAVAALLVVGAVLPALGTVIIGGVAARIRKGQMEVAKDALARADLAEVRLHRLAALLETRRADREGYLAALRAFEGDVRSA